MADLPADDQQAKLAALFPFLPDGTTFTIANGEVTIEVAGVGPSDVIEAERLAAKAEKRAAEWRVRQGQADLRARPPAQPRRHRATSQPGHGLL